MITTSSSLGEARLAIARPVRTVWPPLVAVSGALPVWFGLQASESGDDPVGAVLPIAGIVLAETLLTGLLTAALAIGAGVVGLQLALTLFGSQFPALEGTAFPWQAGVAGIIAGLVAGVLGGLVPALRAARIPIATVMRA